MHRVALGLSALINVSADDSAGTWKILLLSTDGENRLMLFSARNWVRGWSEAWSGGQVRLRDAIKSGNLGKEACP